MAISLAALTVGLTSHVARHAGVVVSDGERGTIGEPGDADERGLGPSGVGPRKTRRDVKRDRGRSRQLSS